MVKLTGARRAPLLSLPDVIADTLRQAIVMGEISPGEALRQDEIAAQFETSRIPVREALRQLHAEGLVALHSNKGALVTALSAGDVRELFEIREMLEPPALALALPNHTPATWRAASDLIDQLDKEAAMNPLGDTNREFHVTLYMPANRPHLIEMIKALYGNTDRYGRSIQSVAGPHEKAQWEHRRILEACRDGRADEAVSLLRRHIREFGANLVAILEGRSVSS